MGKLPYKKLTVSCLDPRDFAIDDLRGAVEYLRPIVTETNRPFVGVVADAGVIKAGNFKLHAKALLTLDQITGKTPDEVWSAFDADIAAQVAHFELRSVNNCQS